jgi:hypothetical protein
MLSCRCICDSVPMLIAAQNASPLWQQHAVIRRIFILNFATQKKQYATCMKWVEPCLLAAEMTPVVFAGVHLPSNLSAFGKGHTLRLAHLMEERCAELAAEQRGCAAAELAVKSAHLPPCLLRLLSLCQQCWSQMPVPLQWTACQGFQNWLVCERPLQPYVWCAPG